MLRMVLYGIVRVLHCGFAKGLTWRAARSDDVGSYEKLDRVDRKTAARKRCQVGSAAVMAARRRRDEDGGPGNAVVAFVGSSAGPPASTGLRAGRLDERQRQHRREQRRGRDRAAAGGADPAHAGEPGPPGDHEARRARRWTGSRSATSPTVTAACWRCGNGTRCCSRSRARTTRSSSCVAVPTARSRRTGPTGRTGWSTSGTTPAGSARRTWATPPSAACCRSTRRSRCR